MSTVTVLGPPSPLGLALADEVESRGFSCHLVSAEVGWFTMASPRAVILAGTDTGESALHGLSSRENEASPAHVLVLGRSSAPAPEVEAWRALCRSSRPVHRVTLAWYPPPVEEGLGAAAYARRAIGLLLSEEDPPAEIALQASVDPG